MEAELLRCIQDAELVFIGIGSGMQVKLQQLKEIPNFSEKLSLLETGPDLEWLIPFLIKYYLDSRYHPEIVRAYKKLERLLAGKNYFIVSLSTDDLIGQMNFRKDRIALPCGTYQKLQCANNCHGRLFDIEEDFWKSVCEWIEGKRKLTEIEEPKCPDCGASLVVNQYGQPNYNENGYLENWNLYRKWLQGTVNRRLCIVELGVGMEFPSIIRWPLEKVCFYNQKSSFFRIHESLYQISEEIRERGVPIKENPIDFLNKMSLDSLVESSEGPEVKDDF